MKLDFAILKFAMKFNYASLPWKQNFRLDNKDNRPHGILSVKLQTNQQSGVNYKIIIDNKSIFEIRTNFSNKIKSFWETFKKLVFGQNLLTFCFEILDLIFPSQLERSFVDSNV